MGKGAMAGVLGTIPSTYGFFKSVFCCWKLRFISVLFGQIDGPI